MSHVQGPLIMDITFTPLLQLGTVDQGHSQKTQIVGAWDLGVFIDLGHIFMKF